MGAVILSCTILTLLMTSQLVRRFAEHEISKSLDDAEQSVQQLFQLRFRLLSDKARSIAEVPHLKAVIGVAAKHHETAFHSASEIRSTAGAPLLLLFDSTGKLLADGADAELYGGNFSARAGMKTALGGEEAVVFWNYEGGAYLVGLSPIVVAEEIAGVLVVGESVDRKLAETVLEVTGRDVLLLRASLTDNAILAGAWRDDNGRGVDQEEIVDLAIALDHAGGRSKRGGVRAALRGEERLAVVSRLEGTGVVVVLSRSVDEIMGLYERFSVWLFGIGALAAGIAVLVSLAISRELSRPIRELTDASLAIAKGDFSTNVAHRRDDEIGDLTHAFNQMASQIESLLEEVREKAEQAMAASLAKSEFLASMSHEIRTPMNGVLGMLRLLETTPLTDKQKEYAQVAQSSANALMSLINDVLDFSKIEAGKMELCSAPFDLVELIEDVRRVFWLDMEAKNLRWECELDPKLPRHCVGDEGRLRQILLNLLGNALKFTEAGEVRLCLGFDEEDGATESERRELGVAALRFAIRDTGIGIPPERLSLLFRSFSQVDSSTTRRFGGTGLGLAICKQIVELMGGTIGVESRVGEGSRFWFTLRLETRQLPVESDRDRGSAAVAGAEGSPPPNGASSDAFESGRILVVDDNSVNQLLVRELLASVGCQCDSVASGSEALDAFDAQTYDLIVMDCQMPGMDGYEATRRIREKERAQQDAAGKATAVPIIALTADVLKGSAEACLAAGMDEYLSKPLDSKQFLETVGRFVRGRDSVES